jgi:hypothetical protein
MTTSGRSGMHPWPDQVAAPEMAARKVYTTQYVRAQRDSENAVQVCFHSWANGKRWPCRDVWAYVAFMAMATLCTAISYDSAGQFQNLCRAISIKLTPTVKKTSCITNQAQDFAGRSNMGTDGPTNQPTN